MKPPAMGGAEDGPGIPPGVAGVALSDNALRALDQARGWARFVGALAFLSCGVLVFAMAGVGLTLKSRVAPNRIALVSMVVTMMVIGALTFQAGLALRGYAKAIRAHARGDAAALARAMRSMRVLLVVTAVAWAWASFDALAVWLLRLVGVDIAS